MRTEQFAKALRQKADHIQKAQAEYSQYRATCKHPKVVILCSEYAGSYSYDYDDGHGEVRLCLVCGIQESGTKEKPHKSLLNPIKRFEYNLSYKQDSEINKTVLAKPINYPLSTLLKFVKENGYKIYG
jgi:hypothetical protein